MRQSRVSIKFGDLLNCHFERVRLTDYMTTAWSIDSRSVNIPCIYHTFDEGIVEINNKIHIFDMNGVLFQRPSSQSHKGGKIHYGSIRMFDRMSTEYEYDYYEDAYYPQIENYEIIPSWKEHKNRIKGGIRKFDIDMLYGPYEERFSMHRSMNVE